MKFTEIKMESNSQKIHSCPATTDYESGSGFPIRVARGNYGFPIRVAGATTDYESGSGIQIHVVKATTDSESGSGF